MNATERLNNYLEGKPVDRTPNLNIVMQFAAKHAGVPYGVYCTDHRYLVDANIKCCRDFGIDMVSAISDPFRETAGFGANVVINEDDVPSCQEHLIQNYGDIKKLSVKDPCKETRMADRIAAIERYKQMCGDEYPIMGWVEGAFAEANDLRGISNLMCDIFDEPEFVGELVEICLEQALCFADAQVSAGAQFIGIGDAVASLVGPELFCQYVLPAEQKLIAGIHRLGARVKLHICGNTTALLPFFSETGADIIDIDHVVDLAQAIESVGTNQFVCGNFDPVSVLLRGTPVDVCEAVTQCLSVGKEQLIISAGCEVPKFTPVENLMAVNEAFFRG